ncbi:TetR/AcrR family transcriptional regulator [Kribbella sp. NPDC004875]|uniref:TetR/AcrR family transcriptional regulator n=1 Tax=Kribbella sp. NPDC004875 TaxID=3364107 RepID=UPI00368C76B0
MARAGLSGARLAQAGADLADEVGFDQVTVSALARRFGVQVASLYSHVKSSQDLKARIATVALSELADAAGAALAGRARQDALAAFANVYRDYAHAHPGRYAAARFVPATPSPEHLEAGRRHTELTRALLRGYDLDEPAQTDAIRLLGSVFHGYVSLELAGSFSHSSPSSPDSTGSWHRILDSLDSLLRTWPERHTP